VISNFFVDIDIWTVQYTIIGRYRQVSWAEGGDVAFNVKIRG